ncbi:MAG: hypothetical protein JO227_25295, partial [Acetobacteraceae bacterium]|nr:hypothetical protein [Acetobacteraceae bacterium]
EVRDAAAEEQRWSADLETIAERVGQPDVTAELVPPVGVVRVPRLRIRWDEARFALTGEDMWRWLLAGEPRVMIDDMSATPDSIEIDPFGLQPGQAEHVAEAIAAVLEAAKHPSKPQPERLIPELAGTWNVAVRFLHGERRHVLHLEQKGGAITGRHESEQFAGPVHGSADAERIALTLLGRYEGSTISYRLEGTLEGRRMVGQVVLGSATDHRQGPINLSQFGTARFEAERQAAR